MRRGGAREPELSSGKGEVRAEEPTRAEQALIRRVSESKATVPELVVEVEAPRAEPPVLLGAVAGALRAFPRVNGAYRDGRFESYGRVNVAWVVDGAVAPVVDDADTRSPEEIGALIGELEARVRDGSITAAELAGATFTVLAAPADRVVPVILPPQAAILGAGERALTLVADARIVTAPVAAAFLRAVREGLGRVR